MVCSMACSAHPVGPLPWQQAALLKAMASIQHQSLRTGSTEWRSMKAPQLSLILALVKTSIWIVLHTSQLIFSTEQGGGGSPIHFSLCSSRLTTVCHQRDTFTSSFLHYQLHRAPPFVLVLRYSHTHTSFMTSLQIHAGVSGTSIISLYISLVSFHCSK